MKMYGFRMFSGALLLLPQLAMSAPTFPSGIKEVSGDIEVVSPPPNVRRQQFESSTAIHVFLEREADLATIPINALAPGVYNAYADFVDTNIFPTGPVRSYFLHFDPEGQSLVRLEGSITFQNPILGVLGRSLTMEQTDFSLGTPGTLYPTDRFGREPEYQSLGTYDFFRIEPDGRSLFVRWEVSTDVDQIRVITAVVPEPSGWILGLAAVLCVLCSRRLAK